MSKPLQKPWDFRFTIAKQTPPKKIGGARGSPLLFTIVDPTLLYVYINILWCISYVSIILVINGDYCKEEKH